MTWYALQLKPAQGDRALANLQNQDIACFYPKITVEKIKVGKRTQKLEPLFSGYLFINLEQTDPMWGQAALYPGCNTGRELCEQTSRHVRRRCPAHQRQPGYSSEAGRHQARR